MSSFDMEANDKRLAHEWECLQDSVGDLLMRETSGLEGAIALICWKLGRMEKPCAPNPAREARELSVRLQEICHRLFPSEINTPRTDLGRVDLLEAEIVRLRVIIGVAR